MKLYFSPGACSLSPHIVIREANMTCELEKVDLSKKQTASGEDFRQINPKGYVPALRLQSGALLTEGPAIVQYLADQVPEKKLAPAIGTMERYRLMEWLNFISTELHKGFSPLFQPTTPPETRQAVSERLANRFDYLQSAMGSQSYLMGEQFSVADAYLFTVLNWSTYVKIDLERWPTLAAYHKRVAARPAVQAAMLEEGLIRR